MIRKLFILLISILLSHCLQAGDSISHMGIFPGDVFFGTVYSQPAAALWRPAPYQADVKLTGSMEERDDYHFLREGSGSRSFGLSADGISRRNNTVFWGDVSYQYRYTEELMWSDVSDHFRVGPYQAADSTGGDMQGEHYHISGGFASEHHGYTWAVEAGYRAGNDYRRRDPRPEINLSDVYIKAGGSMPAGRYQAGLSLMAGKYRQEADIKSVEESRRDNFYAMKGFGMYDRQQSTYNSTYNWLYEGSGYGISVFLLPQNGNGWLVNGSVVSEKTESGIGVNMNRTDPFLFRTLSFDMQAGFSHKTQQYRRQVKAYWYYQTGKGTERLYEYVKIESDPEETQNFYEYRLLSESDKYTRNINRIGASALQEWYATGRNYWLKADAGIRQYEERYASPAYHMDYTHLDLSAGAGAEYIFTRAAFLVAPQVRYLPLVTSGSQVPSEDPMFIRTVQPDMDVMGTSPWGASLKLEYRYRISPKIVWYISGWGSVLAAKDRQSFKTGMSIGVRL